MDGGGVRPRILRVCLYIALISKPSKCINQAKSQKCDEMFFGKFTRKWNICWENVKHDSIVMWQKGQWPERQGTWVQVSVSVLPQITLTSFNTTSTNKLNV